MSRFSKHMVEALRQHLASNKTARLPAGCELIWTWFLDLSAGRSYHANGPNPISWADMAAYDALTQAGIGPHHAQILRSMDAAYIEHVHQRQAPPPDGVKVLPPISDRPMTGALFDALFGG